jgi:phage tail sheath gpL-like
MSVITFSRAPSTKVPVDIQSSNLAPADNTLVLIGRMASGGGTAVANDPLQIENYGDSAAVQAEVDSAFGAGSELGDMVVGAIKAVETTDMVPKKFPPIVVIPMAFGDTDLATALAHNVTLPMPFAAQCFPASDSAHLSDFKDHLIAISGEDRGRLGQFGSFGFTGTDEALSAVTTEGETAASQTMCFAWLRDLNVVKANDPHVLAAATAAICAANGLPFLPLNDVKVGGLNPPTDSKDQHTAGDAGSEAAGLEVGVIPLMTNPDGSIHISRSVTSRRTQQNVADSSYVDLQDWETLYYLRKQIYLLTQQDRYKRARNSKAKHDALKSEAIHILLEMQKLEMVQDVEGHVASIVVTEAPGGNIYATQIDIPVDVIPGFHNKGIFLHGVTV